MNSQESQELLERLRIERAAGASAQPRLLRHVLVFVGVLIPALAGCWSMLARDSAEVVRTVTATAVDAPRGSRAVLDASGYVVARRIATVSAKITGRIREVRIEEGQRVQVGDVMAVLDAADADAQRALSNAQLAAVDSQLGDLQARLVEAEAATARVAALLQRQLVPQAQYDQDLARRDSLRAQLVTAQRNREVAVRQLRIAQIGVENTVVRAPFTGIVVTKAAQPGEIVSPLSSGGFTRTGICTIVDMQSLEVEVDVAEAHIGRVHPNMAVQAVIKAYPQWHIPAKVLAIVPTADRGKATVKVRVGLELQDPRIVPEMGVSVSFIDPATPEESQSPAVTVLVPASAIVMREGVQIAFVVEGDRVRRHPVEVRGRSDEGHTVVVGLRAGSSVVLAPGDDLSHGTRIRVEAG